MAKKTKGPRKTKRAAAKPSAVPPGYRTVTPYLVIDGAAKALDWYKRTFGAKELERSPMLDAKLLHASMKIGDSVVMMSEEFPGADTRSPNAMFAQGEHPGTGSG